MLKFTRKTNPSDFFPQLRLHDRFTTSESLTTQEVYTAAVLHRVFLSTSTTGDGSTFYEVVGALPRHYEVVNMQPGDLEV